MDQLLFEKNPIPMLIYELDTLKILKVNTAFISKYKYRAEEISRKELTLKDIHPAEDVPMLLAAIEHLDADRINDSGVHRHISKEDDIFYMRIVSQDFPFKGKNARLVASYDITEQVEAEKKSADAYEELQHHIANSPLVSIKWDHNFKIKEWSKQAAEMSGYAADEVVGKNIFSVDLFEENESNQIKSKIEAVASGTADRNQCETKIICKDGSRAYIKIHFSALRNPSGELQSVLTLIEDITEQKKSQIKYQRLFESANDSILLLKNGRFVECNKQAEALIKASRAQIIGKRLSYFAPERQPGGLNSDTDAAGHIKKALRDGSNKFEWQHKNAEGELIAVEISLNKMVFPDGEYVQAIVHNINDKKIIKAKLKKSEELFRNLFLKSPAALAMIDAEDRVQLVNESFEKMFGYNLCKIKGKNIDTLIVPKQELDEAPKMKGRGRTDNDFQLEGIRITKSGLAKHMIIVGTPVSVDGEQVAGFGMYIDITDRKRSEKKLKKSLEEKQLLLGEIHHRVKNNLAVISGFIQLQAFESKDKKIQKAFKDTQLRIKSIALVHELLYQSESFSDISLQTYIKKMLSGITDILAVDTEHIQIKMNVEKVAVNINQAIPCAMLINELITNAYKHAFKNSEGGMITVSVKKVDERIQLRVADDGRGLPRNAQDNENSSLGLTLIHTLARQLEADLTHHNDGGTVFNCSFKLKRASAGIHVSSN